MIETSICEGTGYTFGNQTYFDPNTYQETFTSTNGCDSNVTLILSVVTDVIENPIVSLCAGESYQFGNLTLTQSGLYSDSLIAVGGCDSIVNLELTILPTVR